MNDFYITLPREMNIPQGWENTPVPADRINQIAQSRLANWSEEQLKSRKKLCKLTAIALFIGVGISLFWVSIPSVILCGAGLMICLIGSATIHLEQTARAKAKLEQTCLEIEDWLAQFKKACENLNGEAQHLNAVTFSLKLEEFLGEFPENRVKEFGERLKQHHRDLFGEWREVREAKHSDHWISLHFDCGLRWELDVFYAELGEVKRRGQIYQEQVSGMVHNDRNAEDLMAMAKHVDEDHFKRKEIPQNPPLTWAEGVNNETANYLLTGKFHDKRNPQCPKHFPNIMEHVDYWRKSIAVFRSSLSSKS